MATESALIVCLLSAVQSPICQPNPMKSRHGSSKSKLKVISLLHLLFWSKVAGLQKM